MPERLSVWPPMFPFSLIVTPACTGSSHCLSNPHSQHQRAPCSVLPSQDIGTVVRMVQKCGPQIFACVNDPDCKAALDCLQACDPTDQVLLRVPANRSNLQEHTVAPCVIANATTPGKPVSATTPLDTQWVMLSGTAGLQLPVHRDVREQATGGIQPLHPGGGRQLPSPMQ